MTSALLTPAGIAIAAVTFLLNSSFSWLRRRLAAKHERLYQAIQIGVTAAWETFVRGIKREKLQGTRKMNGPERAKAHEIALAIAEAHARKTCPKLWRKTSDAKKMHLIKDALRLAKNGVYPATSPKLDTAPRNGADIQRSS